MVVVLEVAVQMIDEFGREPDVLETRRPLFPGNPGTAATAMMARR
jgi:hypothetical protein